MHPSTLSTRLARPGFETTRNGRLVSVAGATYVAAWVVGLLTAPATPAATAPDDVVHGYYLQHGPAILFQSALIHGVAGVALIVLALAVPPATSASPGLRRAVVGFGVAAALVSLLQVGFAVAGVLGAEADAAATSAALFHAINVADTVKLVLLAGFTGAVTIAASRAAMAPGWLRAVTAVLVVLLPVGGAAFLVDNRALTAALYASLPLLLVWVGSTAFVVGRRAH